MNILHLSKVEPAERWIPGLSKLLPQDKFFTPDSFDPAAIDVVLVARPQEGVTAKLPNVKLIQSLWMGVDGLLADPTFPRDKPLARMIDVGMVAAMTESVVAHVLDYHRHHYFYRARKLDKKWERLPQYMTSDRTVGILGMGELGTAVAERLLQFGFKVAGWKRRPAQIPGIECFHGAEGMLEMLSRCQAIVCLLPLTAETRETNPDKRGLYFRIEVERLDLKNEDGQTLDNLFEVKVTAMRDLPSGRNEELDTASTVASPNLL